MISFVIKSGRLGNNKCGPGAAMCTWEDLTEDVKKLET
jgi:hypothetical protein